MYHDLRLDNSIDEATSTTSTISTMVRLTMTPSIVEGLKLLHNHDGPQATSEEQTAEARQTQTAIDAEPSLKDPQPGNPITHAQVLRLRKKLKGGSHQDFSLESLLRGSQVYSPPPPPKPEPVRFSSRAPRPPLADHAQSPEYKALMARLRRYEEQRTYERMLKQPSRMQAFSQQFPTALSTVQGFAEVNRPIDKSDEGDNEVTFEEVHRQVMLIFNFMVSILGVAGTIWVVARWWSTPARLFVTMGGALVVGIAEVAVYSGYIWRMGEAKKQQAKVKEIKEVVQTWQVVAEPGEKASDGVSTAEIISLDTKRKQDATDEGIRRRLKGEN
ncbi:vacuolar h+-atpase assembly protein [Verticillium dahliae]